MTRIAESHIESFAIESFCNTGWEYLYALDIAPGSEHQERESYEQIILIDRLRKAVSAINPHIPKQAQEQAIQQVLRIYSPDLLFNNEEFHKLLIEKVKVTYQQDGFERGYEVALIDFDNIDNNQFLVVNQFTVLHKQSEQTPRYFPLCKRHPCGCY